MTTVVPLPGSPLTGLQVVDLLRGGEALLQRFFDANPLYFVSVHGEPAGPAEAHGEIHGVLPAGWPCTHKYVFGYRDGTGALQAMVNIVSDLLVPGMWHLATFIVATERHGRGDAQVLHASIEAWAQRAGARWLRLGVVQGHARAEAFWTRQGYAQVAARSGIVMGQRTHTVRVMVKTLHDPAPFDSAGPSAGTGAAGAPFMLWPLTRPQLQALAGSQPPQGLPCTADGDALPPPFVAARSLRLAEDEVPLPWCTSFLIVRRADGLVAGACGFKGAPQAGRVEVGYGVAPAVRGQGAATAALRALVHLAQESGAGEVVAEVLPENHASGRVAMKAGFTPGGTRVDEDGELVVQWSFRRPGHRHGP